MAYSAVFDTQVRSHDGTLLRVLVEEDGYSGEAYAPPVQSWRVANGGSGQGSLDVIYETTARVDLVLETQDHVDEAGRMTRASERQYRLTLYRNGSIEYRGYVKPYDTERDLRQRPVQTLSLRASDRISDLSAPVGTLLQGDPKAGVAIQSILSTLGFGYDLKALMEWRPRTTPSEDPLAWRVPTEAWSRTDDDGNVLQLSRTDALADIVGVMGAQIQQSGGAWQVTQIGATTDGAGTGTVYTYDTNGDVVGSTSEGVTQDFNDAQWLADTGRLSGRPRRRRAEIVYEHGELLTPDINGSFDRPQDDTTDTTAQGWEYIGTPGEAELSGIALEGSLSQRLTGVRAPETDSITQLSTRADDYVQADLGPVNTDIDLTLNAQVRLDDAQEGGGVPDLPDQARMYWSLKGESFSTTGTYWYSQSSGWIEDSTTTKADRRNDLTGEDMQPVGEWRTSELTIPDPPVPLRLTLQLHEAVGRQSSSSADNFTIYGHWDDIQYTSPDNRTALTVVADSGSEEGETFRRTLRIGDGPILSAPGAIEDELGDETALWEAPTEDRTYPILELLAREVIRRQGKPRSVIKLTPREPEKVMSRPSRTKAIQWDGSLYWPVRMSYRELDADYEIVAVEIGDVTPPSEVDVIAGKLDEGGGSVSGTTATSSGSITTDDVTQALGYTPADQDDLVFEIGSFRPGKARGTLPILRHLFQHEYTLTEIVLLATVSPSQDMTVDYSAGGTSGSFTWPAGSSTVTESVSIDVISGDVIDVTLQASNYGPEDVSCTIDATR